MKPTAAMLKLLKQEHRIATGRALARPVRLVQGLCMWSEGGPVLQIPIRIEAPNANGNRYTSAAAVASHIETTILMCRSYLRDLDRARICGLELERLTTGPVGLDSHDNLRGAFKPVVDAACAWILNGSGDINPRTIGHADGRIERMWKGTDKSWPPIYKQSLRQPAHGIRLSFRLLPPSN